MPSYAEITGGFLALNSSASTLSEFSTPPFHTRITFTGLDPGRLGIAPSEPLAVLSGAAA